MTTDTMPELEVWIEGVTLPGSDPEQAAVNFALLAKIPPEQARALLASGKPRRVKRCDVATAEALEKRLTDIGVAVTVRAEQETPTVTPPVHPPQSMPAAASEPEPSPDETPESFNPYAPPKAELTATHDDGHDGWLKQGRVVSPLNAWHWFKDGWALYRERRGFWRCVVFLFGVYFVLLGFLPRFLAGSGINPQALRLIVIMLDISFPLIMGLIAFMAHRDMSGADMRLFEIFGDFKHRVFQVLLIGVLIMLYELAGKAVGKQVFGALAVLPFSNPQVVITTIIPKHPKLLLSMWPGFLLMLPMLLSGYFAPTLAALAGENAFSGLWKGCIAGVKNLPAMLVGTLTAMLVGAVIGVGIFLISVPVSICSSLITSAVGFGLAGSIHKLLMLILCLWFLAPLFCGLLLMPYFATRDIFYEEQEP